MIKERQARALAVLAPPNPLRGLAGDAEYIASFVNQIEGPVSWSGMPTAASPTPSSTPSPTSPPTAPRKRLGFGCPLLTDPAQ
jgi:hypothetical protein